MIEGFVISSIIILLVYCYILLAMSKIKIIKVRVIQHWNYKDWDIQYKTLFFPFWRTLDHVSFKSKEQALDSAALFKNRQTQEVK